MKCPVKRKATRDIDHEADDGLLVQQDESEACGLPCGGMNRAPASIPRQLRLQTGTYSLSSLSSRTAGNEDRFLATTLPPTGFDWAHDAPGLPSMPPMHLLAVFDGHSSASVSQMAMEQLPRVMTQLLHEALAAGTALDDSAMQSILQQAFQQLDALVQPLDNSGSTATVAVVTPDRVHLAWVGDSRAVLLGKGGTVLAYTLEHRATREDEQERVAAAGGAILNNSGLRVMGVLQCTRAIGDRDLQSYGVIPQPDVLSLPRTGQEEFLVMATDGLWDVVANEVVYDHASKILKRAEEQCRQKSTSKGLCCGCFAAGAAAKALAMFARNKRGSRDDITVLLVNLSAACSCTRPASILSSSSATAAASGIPASSSSSGGGITHSLPANQRSAEQLSVHTELHSSPAALPSAAAAAGPGGASALHPEQPWQYSLSEQPIKQKQQPQQPQRTQLRSPQQHGMGPPQQQQQHQQQRRQHHVRQCVRQSRSKDPGLLLQPSVAPATALHHRQHAAGGAGGLSSGSPFSSSAAAGAVAEAVHAAPLSDLAMSSPFAMVLSDVVEVEIEVVDLEMMRVPGAGGGNHLQQQQTAGVVTGRSAPANIVAALSSGGSASLRRQSVSVLTNSRSCGSLEGSQQGKLGSSELPVVVLT